MTANRAPAGLSHFEAARTMTTIKNNALDANYWAEQMASVSQRRDRDGFMRIYDHFAPRVRVYLTGLNCPVAVAQELTQEALLRVWQRATQYDASRSALSTWIFRIARNLFIDRLRKEPQWLVVQDELEQVIEFEDTAAPSPESHAEHAELEGWIEQLPTIQARLIRMSYLEAKTHSEIAKELDMPLGTVKSHIRRAFARLQLSARGEA